MRQDIIYRIDAQKKPYKIYADYVEDTALTQFAECMEQPSVVQGALMPDTHTGYVAPIGSVLGIKDNLFPSFVGYDIGCGMSSITLDLQEDQVSLQQWEDIKNQILRDIPIGFSRHSKPQELSIKLLNMPTTTFAYNVLRETGLYQLGTLGGGNHFLEIGKNTKGNVSIVIHSGSRGVGHKIATHYMKEAAIFNTDEQRYKDEFDVKNKKWRDSFDPISNTDKYYNTQLKKYKEAKKEFVYRRTRARVSNIEDAYPIPLSSDIGQNYLKDMNMALEFALENRKQMIKKSICAINKVLGKSHITSNFINRNHNHADYSESLDLWIHRKGATHAENGMLGVIPGNMIDGSFIVKGKGNLDSMHSSSHGAGRVLSRRKAKDTLDLEEFIESTKHLIANHSDSNLDESPLAYKSIF